MSSLGTRPKKPKAHWPPHNYLVKRAVTGADSWKSLAIFYGRTDPWDVIYFNFDTYNPDEVNWYLYHYVGCRVSKDGKNYSFIGDGTAPLYVYIPHGWWVPPPKKSAADLAKDAKARAIVLATLLPAPAADLRFTFGGLELRVGDIPSITNRILDGRTTVEYYADGTGLAYYDPRHNRLKVPYASPPDLERRGQIVHEAVHAVQDVRGVRSTTRQSEILSFMAQLLYYQRSGGTVLPTTNPAW
jgi:hypothetical protein